MATGGRWILQFAPWVWFDMELLKRLAGTEIFTTAVTS
jgi:hypothetical protein